MRCQHVTCRCYIEAQPVKSKNNQINISNIKFNTDHIKDTMDEIEEEN